MTVGEVVETLIALRDRTSLSWREDDAVCESCRTRKSPMRCGMRYAKRKKQREITKDKRTKGK